MIEQMELNKIYNEDCLETLSRMEDNSVDLIVTSPPYNNGKAHKDSYKSTRTMRVWRQKNYANYNDNMPQQEYEDWQRQVISECLRVLKPTGSFFYNHKDILIDGKIVPPKWVYDFGVHQQIIWNRGSSVANDPHYFQPITEYLYWLVKDARCFLFNKEKSVFRQSVWNINFEINSLHPAPFPEKLVANIILSCSNEQDICYDPFKGGGTTAAVAARYKRNYIGSEISEKYIEWANKRIKNETSQLSLF